MLELAMRVAGALMIALALVHPYFARRLRWQEELTKVDLLTRQVFFVHMLFLCLVLFWMGMMALWMPELLLSPAPLPLLVTGGIAIFWATRLVVQWAVYRPELWRGKPFETKVHWAFTFLWSYFTAVFGVATWEIWKGLAQ